MDDLKRWGIIVSLGFALFVLFSVAALLYDSNRTLRGNNAILEKENSRILTKYAALKIKMEKANREKASKLELLEHGQNRVQDTKADSEKPPVFRLEKLPVLPALPAMPPSVTVENIQAVDKDMPLLAEAKTWLAQCHRGSFHNAIALANVAERFSPDRILWNLGWKEIWKYVAKQSLAECRQKRRGALAELLRIAIYDKKVPLELIESGLTSEEVASLVFNDRIDPISSTVDDSNFGNQADAEERTNGDDERESIAAVNSSSTEESDLLLDWRKHDPPITDFLLSDPWNTKPPE